MPCYVETEYIIRDIYFGCVVNRKKKNCKFPNYWDKNVKANNMGPDQYDQDLHCLQFHLCSS